MPQDSLFSGLKRPILILDGGLGTTLEATCKMQIANTPLWSAEALFREPEAIAAAHLEFMRAGAQVIETSTYQCSFDTFERAGYDMNTTRELMHRSVLLAHRARESFYEERQMGTQNQPGCNPPVRLCLSLGPYGASLSPTQEFGGFYPAPYGPGGFSIDAANLNSFDDEEEEERAIEALTAFHLERLLLFAEDREIWSFIDIIAFETMPLAREAIAVRRTMAQLHNENRLNTNLKQWWVSFVFPEGRCPQIVNSNGTRLVVSDLVRAALSPYPLVKHRPGGGELPIPHGLGINCTSLEFLPRIVREMGAACDEFVSECRPYIVLYPNGGDDFDASLGVWKSGMDERGKNAWANGLVDLVNDILNSPDVKWAGVIVGGCCRCGAEQINRIRKLLG